MQGLTKYLSHKRLSAKRRRHILSSINWTDEIAKLLFILFGAGLILGALCTAALGSVGNAFWAAFTKEYLQQLTNGLLTAFTSSFFASAGLIGAIFFCGLSCIGYPLICILVSAYGVSMGCLCAYLYRAEGFSGLFLHFQLFFLPDLLKTAAILLLAHAALKASSALFKASLLAKITATVPYTTHLVRILFITLAILLISCCLQAILVQLIAPSFVNTTFFSL